MDELIYMLFTIAISGAFVSIFWKFLEEKLHLPKINYLEACVLVLLGYWLSGGALQRVDTKFAVRHELNRHHVSTNH